MLLTLFVIAFVIRAVWPPVMAEAILHIVEPLAVVDEAVSILVDAVPFLLVLNPVAAVFVTIAELHGALSLYKVRFKFSLIA